MGCRSVIRSAVFIVWSVAAFGGVCAQEMPITSAAAYAEKIYLQTDADVYTTDGSIWFNAVVVSSQNLRPTTLSGVLHVELIASDERVVDRKRIKLAGGSGAGSFQLNDSYTQGVYQIRAYTEWNKNFGVDFIAERYVHLFPTSAEIDRTPITALQLHESTPGSYVLYAQLMPTMIDSAHKKDLAAFLTVDPVKSGQKRKGERKEGRQMHVQIIVSRKDITNKIKLSPQNTSRGKNKAHSQKLGQFDRTAFKQSGETLFDELFDFERNLKDSLQYANMMKNGTAQQKAQMHTLTELTERHPQGQPLAMELAHDVAQGMFESVGDMLTTTGSMAADLWELLMAPVEGAGEQQSPIEEEEKRRKRKKKAQSRGIRR